MFAWCFSIGFESKQSCNKHKISKYFIKIFKKPLENHIFYSIIELA